MPSALSLAPLLGQFCALDLIRAARDVPFAVQRIRPIDPSLEFNWHELLIRPRSADPGSVIKFAEASGCAEEIDLIATCAGLRRAHHLAGRISLNVSAQSVSTRGFARKLIRAIETVGFPIERLVIEITETAPITDHCCAIDFTVIIRRAGALVALDDATDPRTSLPLSCIDVLKVDRTLVGTCHPDTDCLAQLQSLATVARKNGIPIVAEGIEQSFQLAIVKELGYTHYQGFMHDPPWMLD